MYGVQAGEFKQAKSSHMQMRASENLSECNLHRQPQISTGITQMTNDKWLAICQMR